MKFKNQAPCIFVLWNTLEICGYVHQICGRKKRDCGRPYLLSFKSPCWKWFFSYFHKVGRSYTSSCLWSEREVTQFVISHTKIRQSVVGVYSASPQCMMKRSRIFHPQICLFGVRIILSESQLEPSRFRKNFLLPPPLPKFALGRALIPGRELFSEKC